MKKRATYSLDQCALDSVTSPEMLAARLSTPRRPVSVDELEDFSKGNGHYSIRHEVKPNGGIRKIEEPKKRLQEIHGRVHSLLARVTLPAYVHSVKKGHSYVTNARQHLGQGELVKLDIERFYPSVRRASVSDFFERQMRCAKDVATLLARILTVDGHLPTGSRSSPILSYFVNKEMFDEIAIYAQTMGLVMTLYVDDICLSGAGANNATIRAVRNIISKHGLRSHKLRQFNKKRPKIITGIVVAGNELRLPNRRHMRIRDGYRALHAAETASAKLHILNKLAGQVHEAAQIEPRHRPSAIQLDQMREKLKNGIMPTVPEYPIPDANG
jgi:RNA-directed DNA polymerase